MRYKVVLSLACVAGLVLLFHRSSPRDSVSSAESPAAETLPVSHAAGSTTAGAAAKTPVIAAGDELPPGLHARWNQPVSEPKFAAFQDWTRRYAAAPDAEARRVLEAEGVALARARLNAMADLIQSNPERALQLAVPFGVRESMPGAVTALLENQVNTRGDYQVIGVLPTPGGNASLPPVVRGAVIDGVQYEVFTYGPALGYVTKQNVPLNGIAVPAGTATVPGSHSILSPRMIMALEKTSARIIDDPAELRRVLQSRPLCPVSELPSVVAFEQGGKIESFCGPAHLKPVAAAGDSSLSTPDGAQNVTAESSYTEGRKRMLLMRPVWSDFTGGMTTNDALTHFQNFSNYMFEMSYGKLVLAPLGRGSDITPPMLLPGLVAEYDNTGLGSLYTTSRSEAQNTHGYNLASYDFTYVCTGSRPAASYAGLAYVGGVGFHMANSYWGADVTSHEFGHNLGLNHAHFWDTSSRSIIGDGQNVEYGDGNDPMGGGGSPNSYNSRYKNALGWIKDTDIVNLNATGSGTYRLYAFDLDVSSGVRGLRFTRNASQNYWLQFRQRKTDKKALMSGVQLLWTDNGNGGSFLLDARLKGNSDNNAVVIGRTFTDPALGLHITPLGKGRTFPESVDVRVNIGSFSANQPPILNVAASTVNAAVAQSVTFTATATDPNADALAYYWDFGDGDYSVDNSAVTTHSFAAAGEYAVQCSASDMKGGVARRTVIVRIGSPTTFRISGRALDTQNRPLGGIRVGTDSGRTAFTDSDGTYVLTGLAAGGHNVDAVEPVLGSLSFAHPAFNNPVTVGPSFTGADLIGVTGSFNLYTPLIAKSAAGWRFLDNGSDQGAAWRAPAFVDSAWGTGTAPLGYPSGSPITTVISYGADANAKHITYYFRRSFNVPDPTAYTNLLLEALRDDSVAIYLNGTEIFRDNLVANATYTTPANDNSSASAYSQTAVSRNLLVSGINYLAAEVHQVGGTSSDVVFDAAISGLSVSNATGFKYIYLTSPANNASLVNPASIGITAAAFAGGGVSLVEFFADGAKIGEDASAPYGIPWSAPTVGSHLLRAIATVAGGAQMTSAPISITVSAPPVLSVELSSPSAGATLTIPANLTLSANVTAGASPISGVQFFYAGAPVALDTIAPYSAAVAESTTGLREIYAVVTDNSGNSVTSAPVSITLVQPATGEQLISFGGVWKYLDDGSNQGTGWTARNFDDRSWAAGPARLGYGGDGEITIVSFGLNSNQRHITTYFRKLFTVANPSAYRGLLLRLMRDDGAVVYLNGVEVLRNNIQPGLVSWNTLATATINAPDETTPVEVELGTAGLIAGTNVIAVEMHQATINSSDLGFDLALAGLESAVPPPGIYLTEPADGAQFNVPAGIVLKAFSPSPAAPLSVSYYADGALIGGGSPAYPFSLVWSNDVVGAHALVAVASWGAGQTATSAPVNIVLQNPSPRIQPVFTALINPGGPWRYYDSATPVAPGWQTTGFADSAWPQGNARFGWGLDGEITPLTEGRITHYFRRWFVFPNPSLLSDLSFLLARDDGAVVYLNGNEIFRSNMPGGPVTPSTLALGSVNTPDETTYYETSLATAGSGIVGGSNLVAVEIHQSSGTSSDAGFDLQLLGYGTTEARVYLTTPSQGAAYTGSPTVSMEAIARGGGSFPVALVEFFANGVKIGETNAAPWRAEWGNVPLGVHSLAARSTDSSGATTDSTPIQISVGRELVFTTFISSNSVWSYLDNGSSQGANWTSLGLNEAGWKTGQTRLGYGGDGEVPPAVSFGPSASAKYITTYFRKKFIVPAGAVYTNLTFKLVRDDGAVVWVNGREVYRVNMPATAITYQTLASASASTTEDEQTFFVTSAMVTNLVAGTNIIAVEIHQAAPDSSDIGFNLELVGSGYEDAVVPPTMNIFYTEGMIELTWPGTAPGWRVYAAPTVDTPANGWAPVAGTATLIGGQYKHQIIPGPGNQFFRLRKQ